LKLFAGHDQQLLQIIPVLLDCRKENLTEGNFIEMTAVGDIVKLMKEAAYSHLMEVSKIFNC
jgi:nucleolar protein 9